jgi:hypothetical protein
VPPRIGWPAITFADTPVTGSISPNTAAFSRIRSVSSKLALARGPLYML